MKRVYQDNIDLDQFEQVKLSNLTDYQQKNPKYLPTHFLLQKNLSGQYEGFDKVIYLRKKY